MEILRLSDGEQFIAGSGTMREVFQRLVKIYDPLLFFCVKGKGHVIIDLKEYDVEDGMLLCLPTGSIVSCTQRSDDLQFSFIVCSSEIFGEVTFRFEHAFLSFLRENPCIEFPKYGMSGMLGFIQGVTELYEDKEHVFRIAVLKNILQCFFMEVYDKSFKHLPVSPLRSTNRREALFKHFLQLVHEHYAKERTVEFYADKLCITSRYLSAVVNSVSGHTPKEFIDRFVVQEIKALLQSTELSMQEIANQLHFPDQSFFGRYFKKHTGMMPSRYRLEYQ